MPETYPKTIHKLPTEISGHAVLAWVTAKNKQGSYPGGYVLACDPGQVQPYVVWEVCTRDGGENWIAGNGRYSYLYADAVDDFAKLLRGSNVATEALTEPEPVMDWRPL